jgi:hypothetical protein
MKNAIIAAVVAAFVASGSTYAATSMINGRSIKPHTIQANRLTSRAVRSLRSSGVTAPRALAAAVNSTIDQEEATATLTESSPHTITAQCPAGDVAIAGGYNEVSNGIGFVLTSDGVSPDGTGWQITAYPENTSNPADQPTLSVNVSCEPSA